jgi:hypothetical protein
MPHSGAEGGSGDHRCSIEEVERVVHRHPVDFELLAEYRTNGTASRVPNRPDGEPASGGDVTGETGGGATPATPHLTSHRDHHDCSNLLRRACPA